MSDSESKALDGLRAALKEEFFAAHLALCDARDDYDAVGQVDPIAARCTEIKANYKYIIAAAALRKAYPYTPQTK